MAQKEINKAHLAGVKVGRALERKELIEEFIRFLKMLKKYEEINIIGLPIMDMWMEIDNKLQSLKEKSK